jgi:hypothetical protein
VAIPVAIVVGVTLTAILGFFLNVALCYGIRDIASLPGPSGLVFAQVRGFKYFEGPLSMYAFQI